MNKLLIALGTLAAALLCAPAWSADAASAPPAAASRACEACPEMVAIPAGEFMMGSAANDAEKGDNEVPQRLVRIKPFALGKFEVTVAQWREFARVSGYQTQAERNALAQGCFTWEGSDGAWAWREGRSWREPGWATSRDNEPVVCISWVDAQAYVRWLDQYSGVKGWRLPTEAEWEYAARAGTTTRRPWADNDNSCDHANGTDRTKGPKGRAWTEPHPCNDRHWFVAPVGTYRANAWGLHDMLGNAWEWVQDCLLPYAGAPGDGSAQEAADCKNRVVRGGAWDEPPSVLRSAERYAQGSANRNNNIGLRVARTLP